MFSKLFTVAVSLVMGLFPVTTVTPCDVTPQTTTLPSHLNILVGGDSISDTSGETSPGAGHWQDELHGLLEKAGIPNTITSVAVSGKPCLYTAQIIDSVLAQYQPDIFILYCGTNDDPNQTCYGESCTGWSFRYVTEAVHNYRPSNPALSVPTLIGYSDATMAPGWLLSNEARANDTIYSQFKYYDRATWFVGIADLQFMPGTSQFLDGDTCDPRTATCAIHPNHHGYITIGKIYYNEFKTKYGLPSLTELGETELCGLDGHRNGWPRQEGKYPKCPET